jgi:glycosyltransferase involved in cell wall biosynthesis
MIITTVMPVYNGEPHLLAALDSLARQTRKPDRVVLLDNCSTDRTREIATNYQELPVEYRLNERNLGLFGNHNRALELAAETDYLHIFHADDVLLPDFYARLLVVLSPVAGRSLGWAYAERIDEAGHFLPSLVPIESGTPVNVSRDGFLKERARLWADIYISGTLLKTDRQPAPCAFRSEYRQAADFFFWAEWACHCGQLLKLREVLSQYRAHALSTTWLNQTDSQVAVEEHWRVISDIEALRGKTGLQRWLRYLKLRCFFAAFVHGQIQTVRGRSPEAAASIGVAGRSKAGWMPWWLGKSAFHLRARLHSLSRHA